MLGRDLLIRGKSAGGCTEATQQPPVLGSTVLPERSYCSYAALAACPQSRIDAFPCSHQLIPLPHSLCFRETNMGFITKAAGLGSQHCSLSCKWALQLSPSPCQAALASITTSMRHMKWKAGLSLRVWPIRGRRKGGTLHDNSWL